MEADIMYGLRQVDEFWHTTIEGTPVGPGAKHKEVANVFYKWLKDGGFQDCIDVHEKLLDEEFARRNARG